MSPSLHRLICGFALSILLPTGAGAQAASPGDAGNATFDAKCTACHGGRLQGGQFGPALSGDAFRAKWSGRAKELSGFISTAMPPNARGSLSDADSNALATFILHRNNLDSPSLSSGAPTLGAEGKATTASTSESAHAGAGPQLVPHDFNDAVAQAELARHQTVLGAVSAVSDAMLKDPPQGEWLHWRRTYDAQGFSPLTRLNRDTAKSLRMVWSLALSGSTNLTTPIVHEGVLFIASGNKVDAIEAATGTRLWNFSRKPGAVLGIPTSQPRNIAIFDKALYVPTTDGHLLALDIVTGKLLWDHAILEPGGPLRLTGGPLVVDGKIIQGVSACLFTTYHGGCFIVALDAKDGHEVWRFNTIARPSGANDSWNGVSLDERTGGSVWATASYDAGTGLVYMGVGQTDLVSPLLRKKSKRGRADGLYTDTTLALDPNTGRLVWYYQHIRGDIWDQDWTFEQTLATLSVKGSPRRVVMTMGKPGILDVLDARTGQYLFSRDLGLQDIVTAIDPKTGEKTIRPSAIPVGNELLHVCPYPVGVRNSPATSFDPSQGILYVPAVETCMTYQWTPAPPGPVAEGDINFVPLPGVKNDGLFGHLAALDVTGNKGEVWVNRTRSVPLSAVLATAGGLLFEGDLDRKFRALDSTTGATLWETRLPDMPSAYPSTFLADGKQCVSITSGGGGADAYRFSTFTPEIGAASGVVVLFVFCEP
jgi:alcohol dehydrogenase (cytochrome c)